jgi:hypothetical protein
MKRLGLNRLAAAATLCVAAGTLLAQGIHWSNAVSQAEAVAVVSRLHVGAREGDVMPFLETNHLRTWVRVGAATGWDSVYVLSNGTQLHLDYRARAMANDGRWGGNGQLQRAFIQSNSVSILSIPLTNAP